MAAPFPSSVPVMKIEDEGNVAASGQIPWDEAQIMEIFRKGIGSRLELRRKAQQCASGSRTAQPPPPPPPVQQAPPLPPPPPPPPPPAQSTWAKRPAVGLPPGLAGVRQPPQKQYQRRPPWQQAQHTPQPAPNAHRSPAPAGLAPLVNANPGGVPPPPPVNAGGTPQLQFDARPVAARPRHSAAARKKPTVPCSVCGVLCMTTWHLKQHEKGRKHQNKMAYLAGEMSVRCQVCNVHLSSQLNVEQHYAGKQHLRRLTGAT